ncbi:MAG: hypothetical protein AB1546_15430 [bacterium]
MKNYKSRKSFLFALMVVVALFVVLSAGKKVVRSQAETTEGDAISILKEIKSKYICMNTGLTIDESASGSALCSDGEKVVRYVQKMIEGGWTREEIMDIFNMLKMGQSLKSLFVETRMPSCAEKDKLKMDLFLMSYCPYGVRYVTDTLSEMVNEFGDKLEVHPYYIMQKAEDGQLNAMHGQPELDGNLQQICVREKWGTDKWLKYMQCFAENIYGQPDEKLKKDWTFCAGEAGIEVDKMKACFEKEATTLAEKDLEMLSKYKAYSSPTAVYDCNMALPGLLPYMKFRPALCGVVLRGKDFNCM